MTKVKQPLKCECGDRLGRGKYGKGFCAKCNVYYQRISINPFKKKRRKK